MVTEGSLCHVLDGDRLLLLHATRGISKGKWNAPGGKIELGESAEDSARRETLEETGLAVGELNFHGVLEFFMGGGERLDFKVHVFSSKDFSGRLVASEEGEVAWFPLVELPYERMWADDRIWLPLLLQGKAFDGRFYYDEANRNVVRHEVTLREDG